MLRGIVVSLLCLLALPSAAQYNIKKMMEEGKRTLDQGYYVTSMQIFSRIVALKPNLYEAWYSMALSKYHLEDYKGAIDDCRRALTLQPYIADIYELYGMSNIRVERYDSAIVAFTRALDITPDNRNYWVNRAYCLYQVIISSNVGSRSMLPPSCVPTSLQVGSQSNSPCSLTVLNSINFPA